MPIACTPYPLTKDYIAIFTTQPTTLTAMNSLISQKWRDKTERDGTIIYLMQIDTFHIKK